MDPHRGFHHRLFNKRQGLGGVLGGLVPSGSPSSAATTASADPQSTGDSLGLGGIVGGFSSLFGDVSSVFIPSSGPSSTTPSTPLTLSSSSSTGSTTTSVPSVQTTTSTSSTTSSSTSTTSTTPTTPTPTPTPTPTSPPPSVANTVYASSDGASVVYVTSELPAASPTAARPTSFLQNHSLEGGVFTLVGIVVLIIGFIIVTCAMRKRRRDRLENDLAVAVTFDPGAMDRYDRQESPIEKHRLSVSSSGHGHGYGYGVQPAYVPQQEYHGYGQYPVAAYQAPTPNPAPYRVPSPTMPQLAGQGGANLTRKFSDRKPVPPLLPNSAYDPSNTHVSIPPQLYHR